MIGRVGGAFGERNGGAWFERPNVESALLYFRIVELTQGDRERVEELTARNPCVVVENASFGYRALETYKEAIIECVIATGTRGWVIDADEVRNIVTVTTMMDTSGLADCAEEADVPEDAWTVVREPRDVGHLQTGHAR